MMLWVVKMCYVRKEQYNRYPETKLQVESVVFLKTKKQPSRILIKN